MIKGRIRSVGKCLRAVIEAGECGGLYMCAVFCLCQPLISFGAEGYIMRRFRPI